MGGYFPAYENKNKQDVKGFDLTLSHNNRVGDFSYGVKLMGSYAKRRWLLYSGDAANAPDYQKLTGKEVGSVIGFVADGLFQSEEEILNSPTMVGKPIRVGDIKYIDRNGDGKATAGLRNYAIYTNKEIEAFTPQQQGHLKQMSYDNRQNFDQEIYSGEATLCFLSPSLFEDLCEAGALIPVSEYTGLPDTAATESYGDVAYGVRLSSLALYTYPGFSELPENTILCLRTNTSMGAFLGGNSTKAMHEANLALAWRLLAAPVYVPESN